MFFVFAFILILPIHVFSEAFGVMERFGAKRGLNKRNMNSGVETKPSHKYRGVQVPWTEYLYLALLLQSCWCVTSSIIYKDERCDLLQNNQTRKWTKCIGSY